MIVIENPNKQANAGERAFVAHLRGKSGLALVNFMVGGGGPRKPGREVDVILFLPHGTFAIEVKHTRAVGELDSPLNDTWSVGDVLDPFSSTSRSPATQADQAAKILASSLESKHWPKAYITPVVSIHGKVTIPEKTRWVGTVGVSTVEHFDLLAKATRTKRAQAEHLGPMLERLGVSKHHVPSLERLLGEGFGDGATSSEPSERATGPSGRTREPAEGADEAARGRGTAKPQVPRRHDPQRDATAAGPETDPPGWLMRPLPSTPYVRSRTVAVTVLVVLIGVWQLVTGDLFSLTVDPEAGRQYFVYGTWESGWAEPADPSDARLSPFLAPLLGMVLAVMFGAAIWLRMKVAPLPRLSAATFLAGVLVIVAGAPLLFASTGWIGVWLTWLLYTVAWPLFTIVWREIREPLARHINRVWMEYEV